MVDVGRFHGQVAGRVEGVAFILWGLVGGLTHRQEVCKSSGVSRTRETGSPTVCWALQGGASDAGLSFQDPPPTHMAPSSAGRLGREWGVLPGNFRSPLMSQSSEL